MTSKVSILIVLILVLYSSGHSQEEKSKEDASLESVVKELVRSHNEDDWLAYSKLLSDERKLYLINAIHFGAGMGANSLRFYTALKESYAKYSLNLSDKDYAMIYEIENYHNITQKELEPFSIFDRKNEVTAALLYAFYRSGNYKPMYFIKEGTSLIDKDTARVDVGMRCFPGILMVGARERPKIESTLKNEAEFRVHFKKTESGAWQISSTELRPSDSNKRNN